MSDSTHTARFHFDEKSQWGGFSQDPARRERKTPDWAIGPFDKYSGNPVFAPDPNSWDCGRYGGGVHNGAVVKKNNRMYYIYRAEFESPDDARLREQRAAGINYHCDIGVAVSDDGKHFERVAGPLFRTGDDFIYSFEDVCCVDAGDRYLIYLNRWDWARQNNPAHSGIICCESKDLIHWTNHGLLFPDASRIHRNPCVLQDVNNKPVKAANGRYVMYINNGLIAFSDDLVHWQSKETGTYWPGGEGCFALSRGNDIILFTGGPHSGHFYAVGEVLLSLDDPETPRDWLEKPVITADPDIPYEDGKYCNPPYKYCSPFSDTIFFTGMTLWQGKLYAYYGGGEYYTCLATCDKF
jgi:predicted GH43/DUF377 family glycosyl hydrolase